MKFDNDEIIDMRKNGFVVNGEDCEMGMAISKDQRAMIRKNGTGYRSHAGGVLTFAGSLGEAIRAVKASKTL